MKKIGLITMAAVFLSFCTNGIQAQTAQTPLNQLEMFRQFIGIWKGEIGKDTTITGEYTAFGNAIESTFNSQTQGKILSSGKQLIGYDKKNDKIILAELYKSSSINIFAFWFRSNNTAVAVPFKDISNPGNATLQIKYELKLPDSFTQTIIRNNRVTAVRTFYRIKQ